MGIFKDFFKENLIIMFNPKTKRIEKIHNELKWPIEELKNIFIGQTNIYIDYANVRPW